MKWIKLALLVLGGLAALVAAVGAMLPVEHVAARSVLLPQSARAVFATITDIDNLPRWRPDLTSVLRLPDRDGKRLYREVSSHGPMLLTVESEEPPHRLVTRIADPDLPFGGSWTFRVEGSGDECTITITEHGEIRNVFFRALGRFVFGHASSIESYLRALAKKCGGTTQVITAAPDPIPTPAK